MFNFNNVNKHKHGNIMSASKTKKAFKYGECEETCITQFLKLLIDM